MQPDSTAAASKPITTWWRSGYCWLVIAGPLSVVLACVVTGFFVYRGADTLSEVYIAEHRPANGDHRVVLSMQPAEAVSNGGALHPRVPH